MDPSSVLKSQIIPAFHFIVLHQAVKRQQHNTYKVIQYAWTENVQDVLYLFVQLYFFSFYYTKYFFRL
jgi:hypothetical protein